MEGGQAPPQVGAKHLCPQSTQPLSVLARQGTLGPLKYPWQFWAPASQPPE